MCRMLLYVTKSEKAISREYIKEFVNIARYGLSAKCGLRPHGDGFGVAWVTARGVGIYKSLNPIWEESIPVFPSLVTLIHARKSSAGRIEIGNTHPFLINNIILAHNGTIYAFKRNPIKYEPMGKTDSEKFLSILAEIFDSYGDLLKAVLEAIMNVELATALNIFSISLTQRRVIVVNLFYRVPKNCQLYYTLWLKREGDEIIISSEPLDREEDWTALSTEPGRMTIVDINLDEPEKLKIYR